MFHRVAASAARVEDRTVYVEKNKMLHYGKCRGLTHG
jgi:hypothetical protein